MMGRRSFIVFLRVLLVIPKGAPVSMELVYVDDRHVPDPRKDYILKYMEWSDWSEAETREYVRWVIHCPKVSSPNDTAGFFLSWFSKGKGLTRSIRRRTCGIAWEPAGPVET